MRNASQSSSKSDSNRRKSSSSSGSNSSSKSSNKSDKASERQNSQKNQNRSESSRSERKESQEEKRDFNTDVFVTGFPPSTREEDFLKLFGKYGEIKKIHFKIDKMTQRKKPYIFVEYLNKEDAMKALSLIHI